MAGPFASSGNQAQEIERVQLKGGFTPDAGALGVAAAVLGEALPRITEAHANTISQGITDQTESVKQALLAAQNPALRGSKFTEEALQNPITREAFKQFNLIQDAAEDGKLPKQYALERLEEIQDTAIANNPAFEKEIRAAMVQATGVDPNKATFQQMLNKQAAGLSPEAKAEQRVRQEAAENNVTYETQLEFNNVAAFAGHEQNRLNMRKTVGTYSLLDTAKEVNLKSGVIMLDLLGSFRKHTTAGTLNTQVIADLKGQANLQIATAMQVVTTASDGVSGPALTAALAPLLQLQESIDGMAEDGSLLKMTQSDVLLKKAILEDNLLNMPDFAAAWTFGGPQGFQALLDFMKLAPTEASEEVLAQMSPKARQQFELRNLSSALVARQYGLLGSGVPAETKKDKQARGVAGGLVVATPGMKEEQYATAQDEMDVVNPDLTWQAYASKKVVNVTKNSIGMKAKLISLQQSNTTGLGEELAQIRANGIDMSKFELQGDTLVFVFPQLGHATKGASTALTDNTSVQAFVARFNRANNISAVNAKAGNLPATRYTTSAAYWEGVQDLFAEQQAAKSGQPVQKTNDTVIKYGRNEAGKATRL